MNDELRRTIYCPYCDSKLRYQTNITFGGYRNTKELMAGETINAYICDKCNTCFDIRSEPSTIVFMYKIDPSHSVEEIRKSGKYVSLSI